MKLKDKFITFIICSIFLFVYFIVGSYKNIKDNIDNVYNVYLNGEMIGIISNKEELYALIDEKQQVVKDKYNVQNVYPPNGLQIIETYAYNPILTDLNTIYNKIEESQNFTIEGYEVKVSETNDHKEFSINVLDKEVFNEALEKFILAFISEEDYNNYLNGTQGDLEDTGIIYNSMGIQENITVKNKYISTKDKIFENSDDLAQNLLFGFNYNEQTYTVKEGDTIESVSEEHTLNTQEFLIANPRFSSKDSLLALGDKVNVTLINPELSFTYTVSEMREVEINFDTKIERDNTKASNYSEITTPGVKGLSIRTSHYDVTNGEPSSEVEIEDKVIREKVDQITTKGRKDSIWGSQTIQDTGSGWRWPTENPFSVTSEFAYRWGRHHNGIDISGSGFGSKIFAVNDGVVVYVSTGCPDVGSYPNSCGGGMGNQVIIDHGNNIYTQYGHLTSKIPVKQGQTVSRGTVIGYMGSSGQSTGTHLHFGFSIGYPGQGTYQNPRSLYR